MRVSPMVKSLYRTARAAYWTKTLWVLHHASCVVTPAQCAQAGSALCWLLSYGVNCANIGPLPFVKVGQVLSPQMQFGHGAEAGSATTPSRTRTARNRSNHVSSVDVYKLHMLSSTSHTSLVGEIRPNRFGPLGPLDNDGCDSSHYTLCTWQWLPFFSSN